MTGKQQQQQQQQQQPEFRPQRRRLVIFVGPHKSASSSLQEFFVQYASGRRKYHNLMAFQRWRWPQVNTPRASLVPERKIFSRLIMNHTDKAQIMRGKEDVSMQLRNDIQDAIQQTWNNPQRIMVRKTPPQGGAEGTNNSPATDGGKRPRASKPEATMGYVNLVIASEEFDRFGPTPYSGRDGMQAIRDLLQLIQPPQLDIVVNYRTPRHKHWLSIWKQLTFIQKSRPPRGPGSNSAAAAAVTIDQEDEIMPGANPVDDLAFQKMARRRASYQNFICNNKMVWEYLDCVSNPLGLVQELRSNQWNVTLIDMGGVEDKEMDISHASSCYVMNVPCSEDGWVRGINHTLSMNSKSRSVDLSEEDLDEMEWLFRKRDCAYASQIRNDRHVSILFEQSLWKDCNFEQEEHIYQQLLNTTFMMRLLQAQYKCRTAKHAPINLTAWIQSVSNGPMQKLAYPSSPKQQLDPVHILANQIQDGNSVLLVADSDALRRFLVQSILFWSALLICILIRYTRRRSRRTQKHVKRIGNV